jgi:hypothetical protein|tara:strand:+ start:7494 stop:7661 length:168 start_codon:yes stop_codon:yes gene_type:complete
MDVEKWKSIVVPMDIYRGIKQIAQMENRSISGQLRVMFDVFCRAEGYQIKKKGQG